MGSEDGVIRALPGRAGSRGEGGAVLIHDPALRENPELVGLVWLRWG